MKHRVTLIAHLLHSIIVLPDLEKRLRVNLGQLSFRQNCCFFFQLPHLCTAISHIENSTWYVNKTEK